MPIFSFFNLFRKNISSPSHFWLLFNLVIIYLLFSHLYKFIWSLSFLLTFLGPNKGNILPELFIITWKLPFSCYFHFRWDNEKHWTSSESPELKGSNNQYVTLKSPTKNITATCTGFMRTISFNIKSSYRFGRYQWREKQIN